MTASPRRGVILSVVLAIASFVGASGLQISGYENATLAVVLCSAGVALVLLACGLGLWRYVKRIRIGLAPENGANSSAKQTDHLAYSIHSEIWGLSLAGLWKSDPYVDFALRLRNTLGVPVTVTGVEGHTICGGEECNTTPTVRNSPVKLTTVSDQYNCELRQPVTERMARRLETDLSSENGIVDFYLAGLKWVGTAGLADRQRPLGACWLHGVDFVVRGPVARQDAANLFRFPVALASTERYSSNGIRKPPTSQ